MRGYSRTCADDFLERWKPCTGEAKDNSTTKLNTKHRTVANVNIERPSPQLKNIFCRFQFNYNSHCSIEDQHILQCGKMLNNIFMNFTSHSVGEFTLPESLIFPEFTNKLHVKRGVKNESPKNRETDNDKALSRTQECSQHWSRMHVVIINCSQIPS